MTRIHHSILTSLWLLLCCCSNSGSEAFTIVPIAATTTRTAAAAAAAASRGGTTAKMSATPPNTTASPTNTKKKSTQDAIRNLKKVLEREYVSMFDPMRTEFYSKDVTFDDPLTTLTGVQAYQNNVDMLASRTLLGRLLFRDGSIVLHSITGGEEKEDGTGISDILTRWTLRFTFQALPWAPTARFSGVSVYNVKEGGSEGVLITAQADYWDSINKVDGGSYQKVSKLVALRDFLQQLQPGGLVATTAAPEVPYQLLSRANGYQVRRYPSFSAVKIKYERRDEGFATLGAFTKGMNPLSPAIMEVQNSKDDKYMLWPLTFAAPGQDDASSTSMIPEEAKLQISQGQYNDCELVTADSQVLAVAEFTDASMEPVVRRVDQELRQMLERDGLSPKKDDVLRFAQYDAIFSIGKRRGEVWIPLRDGGHPW